MLQARIAALEAWVAAVAAQQAQDAASVEASDKQQLERAAALLARYTNNTISVRCCKLGSSVASAAIKRSLQVLARNIDVLVRGRSVNALCSQSSL
jgi:hypothetical protein